ncbi:response regulator [Neobacillus vireti]|nr:response regulator [Neobacillus vireti]
MVIADDEWLIRESLVKSIDWDALGINITGTASNGIEALELVKTEAPQLLLTDIRMPGISGLELIEALKNEHSHMKIIILTGFSEFSYAQKAIKLGVNDFILKPINENELITIVNRLVEEIQTEEKEIDERKKWYVINYLKGLREYQPAFFEQSAPLWKQFAVLSFEEATNGQAIAAKINHRFPNSWNIHDDHSEGILIIYEIADKKETFEELTKIFSDFDGYVGCSEIAADPEQLPALYKQSLIARGQIKIAGKTGCLFFEQLDSYFKIQELLEYINSHYHEQISLQNFSAAFYISDSYLSRIFKQYTGQNFIDYVTKLRIEKAKELLLYSSLKTNEISHSIGYADSRYFSQIFKKLTGYTPSEFKQTAKRKTP